MSLLYSFAFWFPAVSLAVLLAERLVPWRQQRLLRPQLLQDIFWFGFNGYLNRHAFGWLFLAITTWIAASFEQTVGLAPREVGLVAGAPLWAQVALLLVVSDFLEWLIHNALHRVPALWAFHRIHHSIHTMDWIGNYRFHWMEAVVYRSLKYLPLTLLGVEYTAVLVVAVILLTIGHLNHSNLNISWGPLRYVLNSPRMHIWHHDTQIRGTAGVNFAVIFSLWDWLLGTAYMPAGPRMPERLGFKSDDRLPENILWRFFIPFLDRRPADVEGPADQTQARDASPQNDQPVSSEDETG